MDAIVDLLVVLITSLPFVAWCGLLAGRKRQIDTMADLRLLNFVARNARASGNNAPFGNPPAQPANLAEHYFDEMALANLHGREESHADSWMDIASPHQMADSSINPESDLPSVCGCLHADGLSINPASGLPMLNMAFDVAGNPFGFDMNEHQHHGMSLHHSDFFCGLDHSAHSVSNGIHSGHDLFDHDAS